MHTHAIHVRSNTEHTRPNTRTHTHKHTRTRILHEETSDTFVRLAIFGGEKPLFVPLPQTDECLWFSERSGCGHLYLYDLKTGEMKQQVTEGDWLVRDVIDYCPKRPFFFVILPNCSII